MGRKIAPMLTSLILSDRHALATAYPEAGRELRALLAVARTAQRLLETVQDCACSCGEPISGEEGPIDGQAELERALARLRSAGRGSR